MICTPNNVTVVLPTRGRPKLALAAVKHLLAQNPGEIIVVVDAGRAALDFPVRVPVLASVRVIESPSLGSPAATDLGIRAANTPYVLNVIDDIDWSKASPDWLAAACATYRDTFNEQSGVVGINTSEETAAKACLALFSRDFYFKHCDYSVYEKYFGDTELAEKAKLLNAFIPAEQIILPHLVKDGRDAAVMARDCEIYKRRLSFFRAQHPPKKNKVLVALPIYGSVDVNFFQAFSRFLLEAGLDIQIHCDFGDSLVARARNTLTNYFLTETDCTHLLFIDSDLVFSAAQVTRIVSHNQPVVGGFYPKKQQGTTSWVYNSQIYPTPKRPDGLQEVRYIGTGFMCVERSVFEQMIVAHPELAYRPDHNHNRVEYDFWSVGVYHGRGGQNGADPGRYLSEDWYFCQRWLDLGGKVWGDTKIILKHSGAAIYPLLTQEQELFAAANTTKQKSPAALKPLRLVRGRAASKPASRRTRTKTLNSLAPKQVCPSDSGHAQGPAGDSDHAPTSSAGNLTVPGNVVASPVRSGPRALSGAAPAATPTNSHPPHSPIQLGLRG